MGIRRLFIAESKGTRKKDSALSSGVLDFCTPNKRLVRKRSRATQSSFPDREKGYENIPFFISGQRHVTRQTNSDKKTACGTAFVCVFPIKELFDKSRSNAIQILIFIFQRQFVYTKADEDKKSFANDFSSFRPRVAAIGKVEKSDAIRGFEKSE